MSKREFIKQYIKDEGRYCLIEAVSGHNNLTRKLSSYDNSFNTKHIETLYECWLNFNLTEKPSGFLEKNCPKEIKDICKITTFLEKKASETCDLLDFVGIKTAKGLKITDSNLSRFRIDHCEVRKHIEHKKDNYKYTNWINETKLKNAKYQKGLHASKWDTNNKDERNRIMKLGGDIGKKQPKLGRTTRKEGL